MTEASLLELAGHQHGYFTARQAAEDGLSRHALNWRAKQGQLVRVEYGLYRLAHWPPGTNDDLYALQALAPFGTFSHETALNLLGLSDIVPSEIHLTIPESSRLSRRVGIRLHRSRRAAQSDRQLRDGLWVSTAARAFLDCLRIGSDPDQLRAAVLEARVRAMLTRGDIDRLRVYPIFATVL
jgi:predicted transcriptional regulator of viral defense system